MDGGLSHKGEYLRKVFDAIPSMVFLMDRYLNILDLNQAALGFTGADSTGKSIKLCGEIMRCTNAIESKEGCGTTRFCKECVVRNAVGSALQGDTVWRKEFKMILQRDNGTQEVFFLVTASPFEWEESSLVLIVLEDVTELTKLRGIVPICSICKKIRDDHLYWESVEEYIAKRTNLEFSHGICPECMKRYYPEYS